MQNTLWRLYANLHTCSKSHVLYLNISKIVGSKLLPNPRPIVIATAKVLLNVQAHEAVPQLSEWMFWRVCVLVFMTILFWQCCTVQSPFLTTLHLTPWAGACSVLRGSRISTAWNRRLWFTGISNLPSMHLHHFSLITLSSVMSMENIENIFFYPHLYACYS